MAAPNECERGAAEWKSQNEELLFMKVAKEGIQSEREELSAFRKGPVWSSILEYEWRRSDSDWLVEWTQGFDAALPSNFIWERKKKKKKIL